MENNSIHDVISDLLIINLSEIHHISVITDVRNDDCTVFQVAGKPGDVRHLGFEAQLGKEATSNMSLLS